MVDSISSSDAITSPADAWIDAHLSDISKTLSGTCQVQYDDQGKINDKKALLRIIKVTDLIIKDAAKDLREDEDVIRETVKLSMRILTHSLQDEKKAALEIVSKSGLSLEFLSVEMRNDPDVVKEAMNQNGLALEFASKRLRNNLEIATAAVKQCGEAIKFVPEELQCNHLELVFMAIEHTAYNVEHISPKLWENRDVVMAALSQNGYVIGWFNMPDKFFHDKEIIKAAAKVYPTSIDPHRSRIPEKILNELIQEGVISSTNSFKKVLVDKSL